MALSLQAGLKLAQLIANPQSLTPLHRTIEVSAGTLRASSEFGGIEVDITDQQIAEPILVDGTALCAVVPSLDSDDPIRLARDGEILRWEAGAARGHLNLANCDHAMPRDIMPAETYFSWYPAPGFAEAMELALPWIASHLGPVARSALFVAPAAGTEYAA